MQPTLQFPVSSTVINRSKHWQAVKSALEEDDTQYNADAASADAEDADNADDDDDADDADDDHDENDADDLSHYDEYDDNNVEI